MNKQIDAAALKKYIDTLASEISGSQLPFDRGGRKMARLIRSAIVQMQKQEATT